MWIVAAYKFMTSPLGKILAIISGVIILLISLGVIYHFWANSIREAEQLRITVQNQQNIIIQKDKMLKQLDDINVIKDTVSQQQKQINEIGDAVQDKAEKDIDSVPDKEDRPSSEVLKQTFRDLYGVQK